MTNTNKFSEKTKEGFTIWQKTEDGKLFHFVQRDERSTYLAENDAVVTVEDFRVKEGIAIVKITIGWKSDFFQGIGSCRLNDPNTQDHFGLALKRAVDNAAQLMGIGTTTEKDESLSSLNRGLTPEEVVEDAMNGPL